MESDKRIDPNDPPVIFKKPEDDCQTNLDFNKNEKKIEKFQIV